MASTAPAKSLAAYVSARDAFARRLLKGSKQKIDRSTTKFKTVEDFFSAVFYYLKRNWDIYQHEYFLNQVASWGKVINDPTDLENKLWRKQFGSYEKLRQSRPDAWYALLGISSAIQEVAMQVSRAWLNNIPELTVRAWGFKKSELEYFINFGLAVGKHVDRTFVRQSIFADQFSSKTNATLVSNYQPGLENLYPGYAVGKKPPATLFSYAEVFGRDWADLLNALKIETINLKKLIVSRKLSAQYNNLYNYLVEFSAVYSARSTNPAEVFNAWHGLLGRLPEFTKNNCPIIIIPQATAAVAGELNKIDIEIRLGLSTPATKKYERVCRILEREAEQLVNKLSANFSTPYLVPPVICNIQPFAFGPNLFWKTRGESGKEKILVHVNAIAEHAAEQSAPLARQLINSPDYSKSEQEQAAVFSTVLHELGHAVATKDDELVATRIGRSADASILEELKGEVVGLKLLFLAKRKKVLGSTISSAHQSEAALSGLLDFIKNKSSAAGSSGERYYFTGIAIFSALFLNKAITWDKNNKLIIANYTNFFKIIIKLADEILEIYTVTGSPQIVKKYIARIKQQNKSPQIQYLLKRLK